MRNTPWSVCVAAMLAACSTTPPAHPTATSNGDAHEGIVAVPQMEQVVLPASGPSESLSSLRADARRQVVEFCTKKGGTVVWLSERNSYPTWDKLQRHWIFINFYCIDKTMTHTTPEAKEAEIASLKGDLLDKGKMSQDEFDQAKASVLAQP